MWILIVIIVVAGTIAAGASLLWDKERPLPVGGDCGTCHIGADSCERACLADAATKEVEYFDDEELDRYKGRASDSYTPAEVEEFRTVLDTLRGAALRAWGRSLTIRGINLPDEVKDEYILLREEE